MNTHLQLADQPLLFPGLAWEQFKTIQPMLEVPGIRLSFLDGTPELRKVLGRKHEVIKKRIAALLEIYLEFLGIDYTPTGSMTLESEVGLVKREADESYELMKA